MCRIEQFDVVYPNGFRERREQLVACPRGTRSQPCRHAEIVRVADRLASASDLRALAQPRVVPIEPRDLETSRPHSRGSVGRRVPIEGITLDFKFWNPFSSKNKKKTKSKYYIERRRKRQDPHPAGFQHHIPMPPPPPQFQHHIPMPPPHPQMHMRSPVRQESPVIVPIHPPEHHPNHHRPEREPRRRRRPPTPIIIQHHEEDEDESSSPPQANREHRRTRSLSPNTRYEVEKEIIRIRELNERIRRERIIREEQEEREERQRQREEESERRAEARREARRRERREQARIQQEHEDRERLRAEARAQRHREEYNTARRRAADLERQLREEEEENERRNELRRRRDAEIRYQYAAQRRHARARQANIPLAPRHPVDIHRDEGHVDRGERFIRSAIRAENVRQFERGAGWPRGGYDGEGVRRRNTVGGGHRGYDGQRRRDWR